MTGLVCPPHVPVVDLRHEQTDPPPRSLVRQGRVVRRDPSEVEGVTVHQLAVRMGVGPARVRQAGGDRELALHRRCLDLPYHGVCMYETRAVVLAQDLDAYTYHAGRLNAPSLGYAVDGLYPGVEGGDTWDGTAPDPITPELVEAARWGLARLVEEGRQAGMPLRYVWAHRQASAARRADPGEQWWRALVLEWAVPVLGLETQPERTWGDGRAIPMEWDPAGVRGY